MPIYNFKKDTRLYIVRNGLRYRINIYPDITFSQTYNETSVPVKTLHSQYNMFEDAIITKANPANFSFTMPILLDTSNNVVLDLLLEYNNASTEATLNTADLYVEVNTEIYKLENAVIEAGTFQIAKDAVLSVAISGTAAKLTKFTDSLPGTLQIVPATFTFTPITSMLIKIAGIEQKFITSVSIELKNNVQWINYDTLHNSLNVVASDTVMYAEAFVVTSRTLSGTVQQYITDETNNVSTWNIGASFSVQVGRLGRPFTLEFLLPSVVFTNRLEVQDLYIQSYDFRMNSNPTNIADVIKKRSI